MDRFISQKLFEIEIVFHTSSSIPERTSFDCLHYSMESTRNRPCLKSPIFNMRKRWSNTIQETLKYTQRQVLASGKAKWRQKRHFFTENVAVDGKMTILQGIVGFELRSGFWEYHIRECIRSVTFIFRRLGGQRGSKSQLSFLAKT